jgi:hypothetical protein
LLHMSGEGFTHIPRDARLLQHRGAN